MNTENLVWTGPEDNLKAMNCTYIICTFEDGRIWGTAKECSSFFDSVDEAKAAAQKHYEKYDWSGARLI